VIVPYGAKALVERHLQAGEAETLTRMDRAGVRSITCDADTVLECARIADGSLTPVEGFFDRDETDSVVRGNRLASGAYFPLPILLAAPGFDPAGGRQDLLLRTAEGTPFGILEKASIFTYDLDLLCQAMFGVRDVRHPGVARMMNGGNVFAGGALRILPQANDLSRYCLSPADTRREIAQRGWQSCIGFQTRNVPHLAHEHLQRVALETHDGLLIHPVVGWKKADDYRPEVVLDTYRFMAEKMYPARKVLLSGLQIQMRYAGPKEAVMHAIIRQNFGCTHFIVGRDHAGVGGYYGRYDAHRIFDTVQAHLDISVVRLKGPFYCDSCRGIVTEDTCGHPEAQHREVSGTIIRSMLLKGEYPPAEFIRREIVDVIRRHEKIFIDS
jgi:sulfate adenylyltransferase